MADFFIRTHGISKYNKKINTASRSHDIRRNVVKYQKDDTTEPQSCEVHQNDCT
jgi:hypothetical protein